MELLAVMLARLYLGGWALTLFNCGLAAIQDRQLRDPAAIGPALYIALLWPLLALSSLGSMAQWLMDRIGNWLFCEGRDHS